MTVEELQEAILEKMRKKKKDPNLRVPAAYNPIYDKCHMVSEHIATEDAEKIVDFCIKNKSCEAIASEVSASAPRVYQILDEALEIYIFNRAIIVQMLDFDPFVHDKTEADSRAHTREL